MVSACSNNADSSEKTTFVQQIDSLENVISDLSSPHADFIDIPFSKLLSLYEQDSTSFKASIEALGFENFGSIHAKKGAFSKESLKGKGIGIGRYMFHELPTLVRIEGANLLIYTFPIEKLSYYKTAILEKGATRFYEYIGYADKYDAHYISEMYVNRNEREEYTLEYYKGYGSLRIEKRNY